MNTLIKNGTIVTAADIYKGDVLIEGEKIAAIGTGLEERAETVVEAEGKYLFPGGIDAHTHYAIPFMGTKTAGFETSPASVVGGTTTVVDFTPQAAKMSLLDSFHHHKEGEADGKSAVDYALHAMLMDTTNESIFEELPALVKAGVPTIKIFMAYKGTPFYCGDDIVFKMLQKSKEQGVLVMLHCENADMVDILQKQLIAAKKLTPEYHAVSRPEAVETETVIRATLLAKTAKAPVFVVHVSCTEAMEAIRNAQIQGTAAFGETCPHYLVLSVENLTKPNFEGAKYVLSPALRSAWHFDNMWAGLEKGWLQTVGSDHAPFQFETDKKMGLENFTLIPNGAPGVENRLAILYTYGVVPGKLSLTRMVDVFATAPSKFNGLYPRKGSIIIGADADIVVFDPDWAGKISVATSLQGVDFNVYEGFEQKGRPDKVYLRGNLVVDKGQYVGQIGQGKFIAGEPYGAAYTGLSGVKP
ncbi:MAG: dihydropyrimidinase [Deltaproteobacteria bacterium]|nr:dihydropyrimidinase [Deltaproteobacteria bacterium]